MSHDPVRKCLIIWWTQMWTSGQQNLKVCLVKLKQLPYLLQIRVVAAAYSGVTFPEVKMKIKLWTVLFTPWFWPKSLQLSVRGQRMKRVFIFSITVKVHSQIIKIMASLKGNYSDIGEPQFRPKFDTKSFGVFWGGFSSQSYWFGYFVKSKRDVLVDSYKKRQMR